MNAALKPDKLRRSYDAQNLALTTTADIDGGAKIIGQPRGVQAIAFGIKMKSPGYNIYVLGESGTGRTTAIQHFVEEQAGNDPAPSDWIYVNNFQEPHKPLAIQLPAGEGGRLRDSLNQLIKELRVEIARAFDNEAFRDAALEVRQGLESKRDQLFEALQDKAKAMNAVVISTAEGFRIVPGKDGQPLQPQELAQLTKEQHAAWKETDHELQHELNDAIHEARKLEIQAQDDLDDLKRRVAGSVVDVAMEEIKEAFASFGRVIDYLEQLHHDILDNVDLFREEDEVGDEDGEPGRPLSEKFRRYKVNVLVDHSASKSAPVIVEYNPAVPNLLGRVEHEARYGGAIVTDFNLIRAGVLHLANGGYLVLRARDLFTENGAWDTLKRALVERAIRPDDPVTSSGALARSLEPQAIPLDTKVILIGPPGLYYELHAEDEDFQSIFKVMADFDETVPRTAENELEYARFIAKRSREEGLLHLDLVAVGRVIEYGSRLAGTQNKLSTRFGFIADLVRESDYWAREAGRQIVTVDDVERAIDHGEYLRNRIETRMREQLLEGKQLVATDGAIVGQINGLSISQIGDHAFGHPSRVTTRTYVGKQGVIQIDREVELAGAIHNKGVLTLVGYLGGQYAGDQPLSLSAQITFEQNYGGVEGDSASSTELYALLSSLSGKSIKQSIAVTGSVNQLGMIQAIGGVTQKVEGWFNVCKERGLTGEHGVLIPASNVDDLMLRVAIVEAVAAGKFHIWAVESVDQGIEILTGVPAAEIHAAVKARLKNLADILEQYPASSPD
ncbi:MAG: ATP-binding protein [Chloroflexota bacterium]|jgi:lon-related putative ATP-dependent protease